MASSTVFDLISVSLGKSLESIIIPNFVDVAVAVASEFGDEPPSKDSMKLLFEGAFKKALSTPGKKVSEKKEKKVVEKKEKESPKPKVKKTPAPKPQWLSLVDMKEQLSEEKHHFCGFVADRGPNKGKFCATVLTEEHNNCGNFTDGDWVPHSPDAEFESVDKSGCRMRCKKCWSKGKNGHYRKDGAAEKMYAEEFEAQSNVEDLPEVPDVPNDDITEPTQEELVEAEQTNQEEEELNEEEEELNEEDETDTADLLEGLLDTDGQVDDM